MKENELSTSSSQSPTATTTTATIATTTATTATTATTTTKEAIATATTTAEVTTTDMVSNHEENAIRTNSSAANPSANPPQPANRKKKLLQSGKSPRSNRAKPVLSETNNLHQHQITNDLN
eukprot:Pgem_evm1s12429